MGRARGGAERPLPAICLGAGAANARGMRARRARNLDIIRRCRERDSRREIWERERGWRRDGAGRHPCALYPEHSGQASIGLCPTSSSDRSVSLLSV